MEYYVLIDYGHEDMYGECYVSRYETIGPFQLRKDAEEAAEESVGEGYEVFVCKRD